MPKIMYNKESSIELIESQFPDLTPELNDWEEDGIHLQFGAFARFSQDAIDESNKSQWIKITKVFMEIWKDCSPYVKNALSVSFLADLNFTDGKITMKGAEIHEEEQIFGGAGNICP